ncbi:MAG: hypothetical protein M8353_08370 [ANME-2 cluster archaeon]|nr:hypothetical protein [ANME-2 cluster archaeon]
MLYDHEKALKSTEERISRDIPQPNQDLILDYESHCFAQGLKIAWILKQLVELKIIAEMLDKDFRDGDTRDITRLVECIERMDSSDRTKREYKGVVRRFYRWLEKYDLVNWMKIPT